MVSRWLRPGTDSEVLADGSSVMRERKILVIYPASAKYEPAAQLDFFDIFGCISFKLVKSCYGIAVEKKAHLGARGNKYSVGLIIS